jgi:hypothetical protein
MGDTPPMREKKTHCLALRREIEREKKEKNTKNHDQC